MIDDSTKTHDDPLDALIADYIQRVEAGNVPDREALLAAHSELAERLRAFFADYDRLDRQAGDLRLSADPNLTIDRPEQDGELPRVRYFGDYELLEVIARGGMGVVYKARQVSLNRLVALKMLLAGELATERDAARFHAEAEAAAALDHPHIVPIYEVGVHEGRQYFSMKYVEGGSLSMQPRGEPRAEAEQLATIARAVHFAHLRGVLHRDLKPGNILIDGRGTPYVADFGLAKRTDSDRSLSESGAVVGTPRYMAPEQAAGRKDLTVAADVYSLGVILYERLTGTTPFADAASHDIILRILHEEPVSPRQVNRRVPRDLETICLKCLRKDPARRYATAAELAEDLQRFLDGDPVRARPLGIAERFVRWGRRHRTAWIAAGSAAAAVALAMMIPRSVPQAPPVPPAPPIPPPIEFGAPEWLVRADTAGGQLAGTCWRTMEQNVLATSMAALGMPTANSPRPSRLEVRWKPGQPEERVFTVAITKLDEAMQVATLRLQGDDIPKPRIRPATFAPAIMERAKASVVRIQAKREEGMRFGSGFVAQPGLVVTVAHVLGMKDPGSNPPEKIEVVVEAGTPQERKYEGNLLVVDRNENLAVIRIRGSNLPRPMPIVSSAEVQESQTLLTLGYPSSRNFANQRIGFEIVPALKARKCTVTGRIFDKLGVVKYLQIEGGADPGTSGAAVIDTNGEVVAVLVAETAGSNAKFVVPSDYVTNLLEGRLLELQLGQAFQLAGSLELRIDTRIANPARRFDGLSLEIWTSPAPALKQPGDPNNARLAIRPASNVRPIPLPGDGPVVTTKLDYDPEQVVKVGDGQFAGNDIVLPERKADEAYWVRPRYHLVKGGDRWGEAVIVEMGRNPVELKSATLTSKLAPDSGPNSGRTISLDTRCIVNLESADGSIGGGEQGIHATLKENIRSVDAIGDARVRLQIVDVRLNDFDRDSAIQYVPNRFLESLKNVSTDATITRDGQLVSPKPEVSRIPINDRKVLSAFHSQIMDSLEVLSIALPNKKVEPGEVWPIEKSLTFQLGSSALKRETVLFQAHWEYVGTRSRNGRPEAVIRFLGATPPAPGKIGWLDGIVRGEAAIDLATGQIILGTLRANLSADFEAGKVNNKPTHASIILEITLRRTSGESPAALDPRTMLPHQTIVLSPLVGVGAP